MNIRCLFRSLLGALILMVSSGSLSAAERPNILLILADDLGYSDLGCYGGEIETPHLDALANEGLRFTQMYNSARCCPTRASLLTGLYPHQAGIGRFVGNRPKQPHGYRGYLQDNTVTVAEVLRAAGYRTFMTGKWHVNDPVPTQQGFEEFYGFTHGYAADSWNPEMMIRLPEDRPQPEFEEGEYFDSNALTDFALKFLEQSRQETPDQPWFLYVAYHAPHFPVQSPREYRDKYTQIYKRGWDQLRQARLARMKKLGVVKEETALSPRSSIPIPEVAKRHGVPGDMKHNPPWETLPEDRRADLAQRMAVYAGMVDNMDHNIGRMVSNLQQAGELDNTLILFLSDNGACAEWGPYGFDLPPDWLETDRRGHGVNGGTPHLPSRLHTGDESEQLGGPGTGLAYGSGWANLCNTPWSEYKHYTYEGGIATPMIVHWPQGIQSEHRGQFRRQPGYVFDVTATCIDAAEATYPSEQEGHPISPLEGMSLFPVFEGETLPERTLVYEHESNGAIRRGKWKMVGKNVVANRGLREAADWHLHDMETDRTEMKDLADRFPEKVTELEELFLKEAWRTKILPRR